MAELAEGILHAALMRTESRGPRDRIDYRNEDPAWQNPIIMEKRNGDITLNVD